MYKSLLHSLPHNKHHLDRYIMFIEFCINKNTNHNKEKLQKHHICPKANDMFPDYICFVSNPWNKAPLTAREHFISHWMLVKAYPSIKSQKYAFNMLLNKSGKRCSRSFDKFYSDFIKTLRNDVSNRKLFGAKGMVFVYDTNTNKYKRIPKESKLPEGMIYQTPKRKYNKKKYHDPVTQEEFWIDENFEVPDNLVKGRNLSFRSKIRKSSMGNKSNQGRNRYHDPKTEKNYNLLPNDSIIESMSLVLGVSDDVKSIYKEVSKGKNKGTTNPNYGKASKNRKTVTIIEDDNVVYKFESIEEFMNWMKENNTNVRREYWNTGVIKSTKSIKHNWLIGYSIIVY